MAWLKALLFILSRFFDELDRYRAEAKQIRREDRINETKENPNAVANDLFGPSAGRVQQPSVATKTPSDVPTDSPNH